MFDLSQLLTSVAADAMGLRRKRGHRALGFLGGSRRSFFPSSSWIGLAGLAVGAYQIFKDKSGAGTSARTVQPGTQVLGRDGRELEDFPSAAPPLPEIGAADPAKSSSAATPDLPLRAVRVMIAAARCDGQLGEEEIGRLISHSQDAGLEARMRAEWQSPRPLAEICSGIESAAEKRDLYVLAYTVLRADDEVTGAERVFLAQLAARLGLAPELAASIEADTARKIDSVG